MINLRVVGKSDNLTLILGVWVSPKIANLHVWGNLLPPADFMRVGTNLRLWGKCATPTPILGVRGSLKMGNWRLGRGYPIPILGGGSAHTERSGSLLFPTLF